MVVPFLMSCPAKRPLPAIRDVPIQTCTCMPRSFTRGLCPRYAWAKTFVSLHSLTIDHRCVVFCTLATGTPNGSGLQSPHFWDRIICLYPSPQDRIICL